MQSIWVVTNEVEEGKVYFADTPKFPKIFEQCVRKEYDSYLRQDGRVEFENKGHVIVAKIIWLNEEGEEISDKVRARKINLVVDDVVSIIKW